METLEARVIEAALEFSLMLETPEDFKPGDAVTYKAEDGSVTKMDLSDFVGGVVCAAAQQGEDIDRELTSPDAVQQIVGLAGTYLAHKTVDQVTVESWGADEEGESNV